MHPCPMFCGRGETYLEPGAALLHCHVMVGQWTVGRLNIDIDTATVPEYSEKAASPYLLLQI